MTKPDLKAIKARCDAANKPRTATGRCDCESSYTDYYCAVCIEDRVLLRASRDLETHAPQDIPALLAYVDELERENAALRKGARLITEPLPEDVARLYRDFKHVRGRNSELRKERDQARAFQKAAEAETTRCGRLYIEARAEVERLMAALRHIQEMEYECSDKRHGDTCIEQGTLYAACVACSARAALGEKK